jgi:hypothetical protein
MKRIIKLIFWFIIAVMMWACIVLWKDNLGCGERQHTPAPLKRGNPIS